jgi:hypothetical protein
MEQLKLTRIIIIRVKCMKGHNLVVGLMILANLYHEDDFDQGSHQPGLILY